MYNRERIPLKEDLFNQILVSKSWDKFKIEIKSGKILLHLLNKSKVFQIGTFSKEGDHFLWYKKETWKNTHWKDQTISIPKLLFDFFPENTTIQFYFDRNENPTGIWEITKQTILENTERNLVTVGEYVDRGIEEKLYIPYSLWKKVE